jgi:O-antigen/teichoic acid export membrane protein
MSTDNIGKSVFRSISWLGIGKLLSQGFSWTVTLVIASLLDPTAYGLMALSTIISGYAEILSELGFGTAIIQKTEVTQKELSSIFWLSILIGFFMCAACWPISYLTYHMFGSKETISVTQAVGVIFILSGIQVVPTALLKKNMEFRLIAIIEVVSVIISSSIMLAIAKAGGGVWTLALGRISLSFCKTVLVVIYGRWRPSWLMHIREVTSFFHFGFSMTMAMSIRYLWEKSDRYIAGMFWKTSSLGLYTFALQLAQMPTEKVVTLINQVMYSGLAKVKDNPPEFRSLYLSSMKYTSMIVVPLFTLGYLFSSELIGLFLNSKWQVISQLFSLLCVSQIFLALNAVNNFVHAALGRPYFGLIFHVVCLIAMPLSFWVVAPSGVDAFAYPWLITYGVICIIWIAITIKTIHIPTLQYLASIQAGVVGSLLMVIMVKSTRWSLSYYKYHPSLAVEFLSLATAACIVYLAYVFSFEKNTFNKIMSAIR